MTMPQTRHYEMKDSGVEWIGEMPSHWSASPFKKIIAQNDGGVWGEDPIDNDGAVVLRSTEQAVDGKWNIEQPAKRDLSHVAKLRYYKLEIGDLLITKSSGSALHIGKTSIVDADIAKLHCFYSNFMQRVRLKQNVMPKLYWYILNSSIARYQFVFLQNSTSGISNINSKHIDNIIVPVPPLPEQTAIAAYLDEKCATIDAIIAEAKASIEEYKSWKASVIFETVTKGLNPNAEMKDSGVEWIGEIPKGWKVSAVKRHYSITLGKMLESVPQSNDATLENYMCASNVKWGGIDTTTNRQMWFSPVEKEEYLLKEGDLLVMEGGSAGTSAIYRGEYAPCYMQNSVNRCRSKDGSLTHFLYYWMFLVYHSGHVESACNRATIMHLTKEKLGRLPFVYAPEEEQASIVSYLDRKCSLIDGIILEKEDLIRELENYKRSLIFEAVTGKRRVC